MKTGRMMAVLAVVGLIGWSNGAFSEEKPSVADTLKAKAGKIVDAVSNAISKKDDPAKTRIQDLEDKVNKMRDNVKKAAEQFEKAASTSANDRIAKLESVINVVNSSLADLKEDGALYKSIDISIKDSEATMKLYKDKASDPKISGKTREQYEKLSAKFEVTLSSLYDKKIFISKERNKLVVKSKDLLEQRDFIADVMKADELEAANEALANVIESVKSVSQSMDDLAEGVTSMESKGPSKEQK